MFKKIVVPVDGSESAWRALEQAAALACKFEGELLVMTVIQPYNNAALLAVPLDHNIISQSNADLEEVGREVLARARDRVDASGFTGKAEYKIELGSGTDREIIASVLGCKAKRVLCPVAAQTNSRNKKSGSSQFGNCLFVCPFHSEHMLFPQPEAGQQADQTGYAEDDKEAGGYLGKRNRHVHAPQA